MHDERIVFFSSIDSLSLFKERPQKVCFIDLRVRSYITHESGFIFQSTYDHGSK